MTAKMMGASEETIKSLQNEVLRLKLIVFQQGKSLDQRGRPPGQDLDETKRDLIADLMTTNDEQRKQIEELEAKLLEKEREPSEPEREPSEPERPEMYDAACQTNLDRLNIEQLIEASLSLKKLKRQQLQQQEQLIQQRQEVLQKQQLQQQQHQQLQQQLQQQQQQQPQQQQPMYHNHLLRAGNQMTPDEKECLDNLFRMDGLLTTARDKLRAVALN